MAVAASPQRLGHVHPGEGTGERRSGAPSRQLFVC